MLKKIRRFTEKGNKYGGWILAGSVVFSGFLIAAVVVPRPEPEFFVKPAKPATASQRPAPAPTDPSGSEEPAESEATEKALVAEDGSTDGVTSQPWRLPRRLPTPRECFKQKAFNPFGLKLDEETHDAMESFLRDTKSSYEDLYTARQALIEGLAKDKIQRREFVLKKPQVAKGYSYAELATIDGKKTMVYLEIAPGESAELDTASADLLKVFRENQADIREFIDDL